MKNFFYLNLGTVHAIQLILLSGLMHKLHSQLGLIRSLDGSTLYNKKMFSLSFRNFLAE